MLKKNILFGIILSLIVPVTGFGQAKEAKAPAPTYTDPITSMEFVLVKGGCYEMGDTFGDGTSDERPVHEVCIKDLYMGKYVVTQEQWARVMGSNPSNFKSCGGNCPVEKVGWYDAQQYIQKLDQLSGKDYRLPTEAEWEYAARSGGKKEKWSGTNSERELGDYAWTASNSGKQTHPVGQKKPNGLGLYDMTGNVWAWVSDLYRTDYYQKSLKDDPKGPASAMFSHRVLRGGAWDTEPGEARICRRFNHGPERQDSDIGFRIVLAP